MGHEVVDAADQQKVDQPLHHRGTLGPAVGTEGLAHGVAVHMRLDAGKRRSQLRQNIVEEFRVSHAAGDGRRGGILPKARHDLVQHDVDTRHVLPAQCAKIVSRAAADAGVGIHILDNMTNIPHTMCPAPIAQGIGKILVPEAGQGVHIRQAHLRRIVGVGIPQDGDHCRGIRDSVRLHPLRHILPPRQRRTGLSDGAVIERHITAEIPQMLAAEAGFIGEKSGDGLTEFVGISGVVLFVYGIDQQLHRLTGQHIDKPAVIAG